MAKLLTILAIFTLLVSCGAKNLHKSEGKNLYPKATLVDHFSEFDNSAAINIEDVSIEGDLMTMRINYSGGCKTHDFELIGESEVNEGTSNTRRIKLVHYNNGDSCRELITEELSFDISVFAYSNSEEITLLLEGFTEPLNYSKPQ